MAQYTREAFHALEDAYLKIISTPTIDLEPEEITQRSETLYDISRSIIKLETENLQQLQAAFAADESKIKLAIQALKEAIEAKTDHATMLGSIDYGLQLLSNISPFFAF